MRGIGGINPDWGVTTVSIMAGSRVSEVRRWDGWRVSFACPADARDDPLGQDPECGLEPRATWIGCCSSPASSSSLLAPALRRSTVSGGNGRK
jgi:hypothetical protein